MTPNGVQLAASLIDRSEGRIYNAAMTERVLLQPVDYARLAVDVALDKLASDIVMLDIRGSSDFTDYFVILTAGSSRQVESVVEDIEGALESKGAYLHHREGTPRTGWMLLDFGDVIVHIFGAEEREFYGIEEVWSQAVEVVRVQ